METRGKCLCGAVKFVGRGAVKGVEVCHCADCRRWTGGPFLSVRFEESLSHSGPVTWFKSSAWGERGSCALCGSTLFWKLQTEEGAAVAAGALDDQSALTAIEEHIFVDSKPRYYDFADGSPRLTGEEVVARFTASQSQP